MSKIEGSARAPNLQRFILLVSFIDNFEASLSVLRGLIVHVPVETLDYFLPEDNPVHVVKGLTSKFLIHVIIVIRCVLCLCRIIKLNIRNLYQIIILSFDFYINLFRKQYILFWYSSLVLKIGKLIIRGR